MAINRELQKLAIAVAKLQPAANFSYEDMHEAFRQEVAKLVCDEKGNISYHSWEKGKIDVFALMSEMIDDILPPRVNSTLGMFAEMKTFAHGEKPRFQIRRGRNNVKRFLTRVAAAGVYERVRLDRDYFDMEVYAHGGAVYQTLEGFLAGRENISEVFDILLEALEDEVYGDITVALQGTMASMPAANQHTAAGFVQAEFDRILATVRVYGQPVIFCTQEFAANLTPVANFIGDADRADMRNQGYIGKYLGADVVIMPQSFTDATNAEKVIDPSYCYIMPSGAAAEKPVKVAFEGSALIREVAREDWSTEIQMYKKMGIAIVHTHHYGIYRDTNLVV